MEKIPYVQSAAVGIFVKAGSADETEKNNGISHYIEHMLFKGTESRTARQIAEEVDRIGGNINAFTSKEATCYYIKTLDSNLKKACDILIDMFLHSRFDEAEMEKEKLVILEEMKMSEDQPDELVHDMLSELIFRNTPLEKQIIGTRQSLCSIGRQDILSYIGQEYVRDSIVVSIAGNFDEEEMYRYFEGRLSELAAGKETKAAAVCAYRPGYALKVKDVEQTHICMGLPGVSLKDDEMYYAMSLLNNVMGGTMSSRLFQNIREEKGLAYSVYSAATSHTNAGAFYIYAGINSAKVEEAIEGIACELRLLAEQGISEEELSVAKEQTKSSYIFGQESANGRMFSNGKNTLLLNEVRQPQRVLRDIDAVTMETVARAADKISDLSRYCVAVVSNRDWDIEAIMKRQCER